MRYLVDRATFDSSQGGTIVTLRRRIFDVPEKAVERDT
jgi:hypothetical protein